MPASFKTIARFFWCTSALYFSASSSTLLATDPLPVYRPAPEFAFTAPGGKQLLLSSYRGKVVLMEFLFTTCPHCQTMSKLMNQMYHDYGTLGFQPLGVAINERSEMLLPEFIKTYGITYPVGSSSRETALTFLGFSQSERYVVPQLVLIDRKGVIRGQTPPLSDENFLLEKNLREKIQALLKESGSGKSSSSRNRTAAKKRPS